MLQKIKSIFAAPQFSNPETTRSARYLNVILWAIACALTALLLIRLNAGQPFRTTTHIAFTVLITLMLVLQVVMRVGQVRLASVLLSFFGWLGLTYISWNADGVRDTSFVALIVIILLTNLLLDYRYSFGITFLVILTGWALAYGQNNGLVPLAPNLPTDFATEFTFIYTVIAILSYLTVSGLRSALAQSQNTALELGKNNLELESLRQDLEERVRERTAEIESTSSKYSRRAQQLQAVTLVSRTISELKDLQVLLPQIAQTISKEFGYYHVGIFLPDEPKKFIELQASNSQGGRDMLLRGHKLPIGEASIVGYAAATKQTRIALDVGQDSTFFNNPDLPQTRSEIALPLLNKAELVGVLDVQSTEPGAFDESDVDILNTLAIQVSIAIENARLLNDTQKAILEAERNYQTYIRQEWKRFRDRRAVSGYKYAENTVTKLSTAEVNQGGHVVPVLLHGGMLGELQIHAPGRTWNEDEIALVQAAAERAALALENARLIDSTRTRAQRERMIADVSSKVSSSTDFDKVMRATVEELGRVLNAPEIFIQIDTPQSGVGE